MYAKDLLKFCPMKEAKMYRKVMFLSYPEKNLVLDKVPILGPLLASKYCVWWKRQRGI